MEQLQLTTLYTAILALIFSVLTLVVVIQRRKNDIPYGDGGNTVLRGAIRAHGNFAEYVPLSIVLLGLLEINGTSDIVINGMFLTLIAARISHAIAMFALLKSRLYFVTRVFGAFTTWLIILSSAVLLLLGVL